MKHPRKIAVIGAGAMGCLYAGMLAEKNDVTILDVSIDTLTAVRERGILQREPDGKELCRFVKAEKSGECRKTFDLVILFVKDTVSKIALESNRAIFGKETITLSLQNGMGNYEVIREVLPERSILLGTSKHNSVVFSPGEIYHSGSGITQIGSPSKNFEAAEEVVEIFRDSGIDCEACENVNHLLWKKLFVNMTVNPITAILDAPIGILTDDPSCRALTKALIEEAIAVAKADGEIFDPEETENDVFSLSERLKDGRASMCQDMEHRRKTEIDFINGAVVRLGEKYRIPTPIHKTIALLIHAKENLI